MFALHAWYENGKIQFLFEPPAAEGPLQVLVVFPNPPEEPYDLEDPSSDPFSDSPWPDWE
ncbi:MAG: hypothetical protein H6510_03260 [Acidobacteria bacterium]|nr:hypothetical protein [Acidobacteriota bacterium]MCB9396816.1 hypothetical protein [Acidobacteriota bacterium]